MPDPRRLGAALREPRTLRALAGAAVLALVLTYALAGLGGLVLALSLLTVCGTIAASVGVAAAPAVPTTARPPKPRPNVPFRTYRQVAEQLSWATVSPRHYDVVTRPLLQRLMVSRLAERHRVDAERDVGAARALVGEDVWTWLDPARPAESSSQAPGIDEQTLHVIVARLEAL